MGFTIKTVAALINTNYITSFFYSPELAINHFKKHHEIHPICIFICFRR